MVKAEKFAANMYAAKKRVYVDHDNKLMQSFEKVEEAYQRCSEVLFNLQINGLQDANPPEWIARRDQSSLYHGLVNQAQGLLRLCFELNSSYFSKYGEYIFGRIEGDELEIIRLMRWYTDYSKLNIIV